MMGYIKGFWDYRFLLHELVIRGIRLKYRRSYLGIVWSVVPLRWLNTFIIAQMPANVAAMYR